VCLAGDFNSDFGRTTPNTQELTEFCTAENFVPLINNEKSTVNYTFEAACGTLSCIDHIIVTENFVNSVNAYYCIEDVDNLSDHLPVVVELDFPSDYNKDCTTQNTTKCAWYKASIKDISKYKSILDTHLDSFWCDNLESILCSDVTCSKDNHVCELNSLYYHILYSCLQASTECIPMMSNNLKRKTVPGFAEYCKPLRDEALYWHNLWKSQGRPNCGYFTDMRKNARSQYHKSVRKVKANENKIRSQRMAEALKCNKQRDLWSEVKKIKSTARSVSSNIDGHTNFEDITKLFAGKYETLYNSVNYDDIEIQELLDCVNNLIKCGNTDVYYLAVFDDCDV
jgi:hypothetical protein